LFVCLCTHRFPSRTNAIDLPNAAADTETVPLFPINLMDCIGLARPVVTEGNPWTVSISAINTIPFESKLGSETATSGWLFDEAIKGERVIATVLPNASSVNLVAKAVGRGDIKIDLPSRMSLASPPKL
jgi:hypothetical protein